MKHIHASGHHISSQDLRLLASAIATSNTIESVAIGDNTMGDTGVISFSEPFGCTLNHSIQKIDFSWKNISCEGFSFIGKTFGTSTTNLTFLDLSRNNKGLADKSVLELCSSASYNNNQPFPCLTHLNLSDCQVGPHGVLALVQTLLESEYPCDQASKLTLLLNNNPLIGQSPKCLSYFFRSSSNRLTSLSLTHCDIDDAGIRALVDSCNHHLSCRTTLTSLNISHNRIGANGAASISESFLFVDSSCPLQQLNVAGNPIGPAGVRAIASKLQQREDIQIHPNSFNIPTCTSLRELDLSNTGCGIEGAVAILQCGGNLHSVRLFDNDLRDGFLHISRLLAGGHPNLQLLDLGGNRASEDAVCTLLESLLQDHSLPSTLQVLELGGNQFTNTCEELLKQIKIKIPTLDIVHNRQLDY